jgi:hypothetical protein
MASSSRPLTLVKFHPAQGRLGNTFGVTAGGHRHQHDRGHQLARQRYFPGIFPGVGPVGLLEPPVAPSLGAPLLSPPCLESATPLPPESTPPFGGGDAILSDGRMTGPSGTSVLCCALAVIAVTHAKTKTSKIFPAMSDSLHKSTFPSTDRSSGLETCVRAHLTDIASQLLQVRRSVRPLGLAPYAQRRLAMNGFIALV